jgi:serine/threonine protein kinase
MEPVSKSRQVLVDDKTYSVMSVRNGGMGRVWLLEKTFDDSFDPIYRRRIAVKTFEFMKDEQAIEHELNIWISLDHCSVLPLKKIGRLNYRLAAIMPLLDGSLDDVIEARGSLIEQEVSKIISDMVDGLEYAWSAFRILHLDLKPSNVLVESNSPIRTKIADWGISRLAAVNQLARGLKGGSATMATHSQKTAYAAGTPLFMAPERFSGDWSLSPTADIYSLGMMAVQLNTGILPFRFGQVDPAEEIATGSFIENARQMLENRSDDFRRFCMQCIHPNPAARPRTFRDVAAQLNSIAKKGNK